MHAKRIHGIGKRVPWAALAAALPGLYFAIDATRRSSFTTLGRDQGIFQYVAWAVRQGDVLYRDIRDVNGPVIPMVHIVFQWLGGEDEHRFRVLDLLVTGLSFAIAGALVAARARPIERAAWALAAWVALSAQYLVYGFWDTAQRESFLDWFVLVSISLQFACAPAATRRERLILFMTGALSFAPWLGKPTFALFTVAQAVALVVEPDRWRRAVPFAAGGAVGLLVPFVFVLVKGDVRAWWTITFHDVPAMYRFIWPRPASAILALPGYSTTALLALATSLALGGLIARRLLPLRAIPIAAMPVLGLVSMLVQAKGFPYHWHPVTLGTTFAWIVAAAALRDRFPIVAVVGAAAIGVHAAMLARATPVPPLPTAGEELESEERLAYFDRVDFFPHQFRLAAASIAEHAAPSDRVAAYSMDAYILFLARRRSATPYIYAYDLNADWALVGAYDEGGIHPTEAQQAVIRAMRDEHIADYTARIKAHPPPVWVVVSLSPLMTNQSGEKDLELHCPEAAEYLHEEYSDLGGYPAAVWVKRAK